MGKICKWHRSVLILAVGLSIGFHGVESVVTDADQRLHPIRRRDAMPTCQAKDFHYEYTECDSAGGRWRVSVPKANTCEGGAPNPPVRGKSCDFSCDEGHYLDISADQNCHPCSPGTYSTGGGVRFTHWSDPLPPDFTRSQESWEGLTLGKEETGEGCNGTGWMPQGEVLVAPRSPCASTLTYRTYLKKEGYVSYTYQYNSDSTLFTFEVQNSDCNRAGHHHMSSSFSDNQAHWPSLTLTKGGETQWKTVSAKLTKGQNILSWRVASLSPHTLATPPVLLKRIEVYGIAYQSSCTPCPPGSYAPKSGSKECDPCPLNTYSMEGQQGCEACNTSREYSARGSDKCLPRPACKSSDYFQYHTSCDKQNKAQVMYKWVEPKLCLDAHPGSVSLPPSGKKEECPPCSPGMYYTTNSTVMCDFCPKGTYSNGAEACRPCEAGTAPVYGYFYKWWNGWPPNLSGTCVTLDDQGCTSDDGWLPSSDHIQSGVGHSDDVYLVLTLNASHGFRTHTRRHSQQAAGLISFVFELQCQADCQFFFMTEQHDSPKVIQKWEGMNTKQSFTYEVADSDPILFRWAFTKVPWLDDSSPMSPSKSHKYADDKMLIYSINVTNTHDGGAQTCRPCPQGLSGHDCIPCPTGSYSSPSASHCISCPLDTVIVSAPPPSAHPSSSLSSTSSLTSSSSPSPFSPCVPCGPGLTPNNYEYCYSSCQLQIPHPANTSLSRSFDLSPMKGFHEIQGSRMFTGSGIEYSHVFNFSLCSSDGQPIVCSNNGSSTFNEEYQMYTTWACRVTVALQGDTAYSTQPVSLGDQVLAVTHATRYGNLSADRGLFDLYLGPARSPDPAPGASDPRTGASDPRAAVSDPRDLFIYYSSDQPTPSCQRGHSLVVGLHCDPDENRNDTILPPPRCPDGTCDGCTFHLMWVSKFACPLCGPEDYMRVQGECVAGEREVHYLAPTNCRVTATSGRKMKSLREKCHVTLPLEIKMVIGGAAVLGVVFLVVIIYMWKTQRKLEYKYMKLVESSSAGGKDGELPGVDSCGLEASDDDDDEGEGGAGGGGAPVVNVRGVGGGGRVRQALGRLINPTHKMEKGHLLEKMHFDDEQQQPYT